MKINTFLLFLAGGFFMLTSCSKPTDTQDVVQKPDTLADAPKPDWLGINGKTYMLDSISKDEFLTAKKSIKIRVGEMELIDDTTNVVRDSLSLKFQLRNGADTVLVNYNEDDVDKYVNFKFVETLSQIDYWLLEGNYWEWHILHLIDKDNGNSIAVYGEPTFSPNGHYFVCWSKDMEAGFSPNGIQLFKIESRKAELIWETDISVWGPAEVRWKDDNTLYIAQSLSVDGGNMKYRKMKLF